MGVSLLRELKESDIGCPAGSVRGGCGVLCAIEQSFIDGRIDPTSIEVYCGGDSSMGGGYMSCPTWRKMKEAEARGEELMVEKPESHQRAAKAAAAYWRARQGKNAINPEVIERVRRRTALETARGRE